MDSFGDVAVCCPETSAWVYIGNQVYDITPWLDRHPGGKEILLLSAGRDISDLFVTYHPFTDKAAEVIGKYHIGEVSSTEFPQFAPDRGFYQECRQKVGEYFRANKIDHKDPKAGLWRLALFFALAAVAYTILVQGTAWSWPVRILAAILLGVTQALPLLHTMHDASHLAIGSTPGWWRNMGRLCMDWYAGASLYSWSHTQTNAQCSLTRRLGAVAAAVPRSLVLPRLSLLACACSGTISTRSVTTCTRTCTAPTLICRWWRRATFVASLLSSAGLACTSSSTSI